MHSAQDSKNQLGATVVLALPSSLRQMVEFLLVAPSEGAIMAAPEGARAPRVDGSHARPQGERTNRARKARGIDGRSPAATLR
jgi:hypothetical protein